MRQLAIAVVIAACTGAPALAGGYGRPCHHYHTYAVGPTYVYTSTYVTNDYPWPGYRHYCHRHYSYYPSYYRYHHYVRYHRYDRYRSYHRYRRYYRYWYR